jgi:hypothetical protein
VSNQLDLHELKDLCQGAPDIQRAEAAVSGLRYLAGWWLNDETMRLANTRNRLALKEYIRVDRTKLSTVVGSCWITCAIKEPSLTLLRSAVVVPLQWRKDVPHDETLPKELRRLADEVLSELVKQKELPKDSQQWGLHPAFNYGVRLNDDLFETVDSGWASLAVGVIAAAMGLAPRTDVWASMAWKDGYPAKVKVEGLQQKIETAKAFGATKFFMHSEQVHKSQSQAIEVLSAGIKNPQNLNEAIRDLVAAFTHEPAKPIPESPEEELQFDRCRKYFLTLTGFASRSNAFYRTHLLESIIHRYRKRYLEQAGSLRVRRFVTIVSVSPELVEITVKAIRPDKVLLLHTKHNEQTAHAATAKKLWRKWILN